MQRVRLSYNFCNHRFQRVLGIVTINAHIISVFHVIKMPSVAIYQPGPDTRPQRLGGKGILVSYYEVRLDDLADCLALTYNVIDTSS